MKKNNSEEKLTIQFIDNQILKKLCMINNNNIAETKNYSLKNYGLKNKYLSPVWRHPTLNCQHLTLTPKI